MPPPNVFTIAPGPAVSRHAGAGAGGARRGRSAAPAAHDRPATDAARGALAARGVSASHGGGRRGRRRCCCRACARSAISTRMRLPSGISALGRGRGDAGDPAGDPGAAAAAAADPPRARLERAKDGTALLPGQAAALAAALARLLDMAASEEASFDRLHELAPAEYAEHWQLVLDFLEMLPRLWPPILEAEGAIDPADRRNRLLRRQARLWREAPPRAPVIAAGLMGGMPALSDLLSAVAWLDQGAVILPGLDRAASPEEWELIADGAEPSAAPDGLLLRELELTPDEVRRLAAEARSGRSPPPRPAPRPRAGDGKRSGARRMPRRAPAAASRRTGAAPRRLDRFVARPRAGRPRRRSPGCRATTAPARRTRERRSRCCCGGRSKRRA